MQGARDGGYASVNPLDQTSLLTIKLCGTRWCVLAILLRPRQLRLSKASPLGQSSSSTFFFVRRNTYIHTHIHTRHASEIHLTQFRVRVSEYCLRQAKWSVGAKGGDISEYFVPKTFCLVDDLWSRGESFRTLLHAMAHPALFDPRHPPRDRRTPVFTSSGSSSVVRICDGLAGTSTIYKY